MTTTPPTDFKTFMENAFREADESIARARKAARVADREALDALMLMVSGVVINFVLDEMKEHMDHPPDCTISKTMARVSRDMLKLGRVAFPDANFQELGRELSRVALSGAIKNAFAKMRTAAPQPNGEPS